MFQSSALYVPPYVMHKNYEETDGYEDTVNNENMKPEQPVSAPTPPPQENKVEQKAVEKQSNESKCSDCGTDIDSNVYNYSVKFFKMPLCIKCQKNHKK